MREEGEAFHEPQEGDIMAGDRRIARADTALPDWYASDAAYRPIPIVWFGGALVLQAIAQPAVAFVALSVLGLSAWIALILAALVTAVIWRYVWAKGMAGAGAGWRWATILTLLLFLGITGLGLFA